MKRPYRRRMIAVLSFVSFIVLTTQPIAQAAVTAAGQLFSYDADNSDGFDVEGDMASTGSVAWGATGFGCVSGSFTTTEGYRIDFGEVDDGPLTVPLCFGFLNFVGCSGEADLTIPGEGRITGSINGTGGNNRFEATFDGPGTTYDGTFEIVN